MTTTIKADIRTVKGNDNRVLRRNSKTPGVIYGNKKETILIEFGTNELLKAVKNAEDDSFQLEIDNKSFNVKLQHIDLNPRNHSINHVDFLYN
jgi:large subunit ribosomal protein L25